MDKFRQTVKIQKGYHQTYSTEKTLKAKSVLHVAVQYELRKFNPISPSAPHHLDSLGSGTSGLLWLSLDSHPELTSSSSGPLQLAWATLFSEPWKFNIVVTSSGRSISCFHPQSFRALLSSKFIGQLSARIRHGKGA